MKKRMFLLAGILVLAGISLVLADTLNSDSAGGNTEWRMFGKYLNHTRWDGVAFSTISGLNRANFTTLGVIDSSPAVANGYVYIGSYDDKLYQLNASNVSQIIANYTTGDDICSSPAVANGYVYVGSYDDRLYQLNASNISQIIASYITGANIFSSPAVAGGYVYVGSMDKNLYQLNSSNISQLIANYTTGSVISSSPAVANGYVYVGSHNNSLCQLNASNVSQLIAKYTTGYYIIPSPAVANNFVYIGGQDGVINQLNASNVSQIIANYSTDSSIQSSPAVANGYVYIGDQNGVLYQLNASNVSQQIANYTTESGDSIDSSPAVANGYVYVGTYYNYTYQLNASNVSQIIANYSTGNMIGYSSPAVANGYVYIGSNDGNLYQLNASNIGLGNAIADADGDGVEDSSDPLLYNETNVNVTGISNLNITIAGNSTNGSYSGVQEIVFYDSATKIINFTFNLSASNLDLSKIKIIKETNSLIVNLSGQVQSIYNKTLYINDNDFASLCVKDAEISAISEVSSGCNGANETDFTSCIGGSLTANGIACTDEGATIKIANLRHSAIKGTPATTAAAATTAGGAGGCLTNWACSEWSECVNDEQTRICTKIKEYCYGGIKPNEKQDCEMSLAPSEEEEGIGEEISSEKEKTNWLVIGISIIMTALIISAIIVLIILTKRRQKHTKRFF